MKKRVFIVIMSILAISKGYSQLNSSGQKSLEMLLSPLGSEPIKINGIRGRYFISENSAIRTTVFLGGSRDNSITQESGDNLMELHSRKSKTDFSLTPGYEIHLPSKHKISPYYGIEAQFSISKSKDYSEQQWSSELKVQETILKSRNSTIGINLVSGVDCYLSEGLFLGFELGFGASKDLKGMKSTKYNNAESSSLTDSKSKGNSTSLNWGPNYVGAIRLGWKF
jgi:hypothetical protein